MKKKLYLVTILVLAGSIVACMLAITKTESTKCDIASLVLDEEAMPEGWTSEWSVLPPALESLGAREAYSTFMQNGDETASHTVYRYSNRWLAAFHFWFDKQSFFPTGIVKWSDLRGASSLLLHADQIQIKCSDGNDPYLGNRCTAVLRYGLYISDFGSSIQEGVISTEEFKEIVLKIDKLFGPCTE